MILNVNETHQSQGLHKVCDFKISSNGIMIRALTQRLYSDPISSVVRELACNALDACPTIPMSITMPTHLNPTFTIRDHGPGLSPDDMVRIFATFGESTKRHTNDQIGGFGLGAKSPFALTNSFTITSRHQGVRTTYIASIGQDGMPGLHVASRSTTHEDGLEIQVPATDFDKWTKALDQIRLFSPAPLVNGKPIPQISYQYDTEELALPSLQDMAEAKPTVLVGPVAYPLEIPNTLTRIPAILKFPIGAIEVTASREAIVYTPEVQALLKSRYYAASKIFCDLTDDLLAEADLPLVQKIIEWQPAKHSHIWKGQFKVTAYHIEPLSDRPWQHFYSAPKARWVVRGTPGTSFRLSATPIYVDIDKGWQQRIIASGLTGSVVITRDPAALLLPNVVKVSSLPDPAPKASPTRKSSLSGRARIWVNGFLAKAPAGSTYCLTVSSFKKPYLKGARLLLTSSIHSAIERRLGKTVVLTTAPTKNMTDVTAEHRSLVDAWIKDHYAEVQDNTSHRLFTVPSIPLIEFLHAKGLLQRPAPVDPDVLLYASADPAYVSPWPARLRLLREQHPLLFWASQNLDWSKPETVQVLSRLI